MDDRTAQFIDVFHAFLDEVVTAHRAARPAAETDLSSHLQAHLGVDPHRLPVVSEDVAGYRFVDLDVALSEVQQRSEQSQLLGIGGGDQRRHSSLSEILEGAGRYGQFPLGPVDYGNLATGPDSARQVVSFGLRLFTFAGVPVVVLQRSADRRSGDGSARMEVLTPTPGVAAELISAVRALMVQRSVLRGHVLTLGGSEYEPSVGGVTFHRRPAMASDDLILPAGVLERVHRHVAGVARHREQLRAAGQHLKRGLLLYGPPGTGKTHTVRYLLSALPQLTVILLAGPSIQYVSEATLMARALQPALVVLEDCDLVAENRDYHPGAQPLLFEVLEALDGLSDDADVAFLLTTIRADVLEPALAQRPGRVDLAVEIPLPDEHARRLLIHRYARRLPLSEQTLADAAARTPGTTASFAKELVRRSVLIAAEAGHEPGDTDLEQALTEMLSEAQSVTRSLLGTPDRDDADNPPAR